jgi:hypothetical protein
MPETLANGASSTLNGAINNSQTTIAIQSADSGKFPPSGTYRIAVTDGSNVELMTVTGGQGTATLTVSRASEKYGAAQTAFGFASGSTVAQVLTNAGLAALIGSGGGGGAAASGGLNVYLATTFS